MKKQTIFIFITILFSTYSFTQTKKNEKSDSKNLNIDIRDLEKGSYFLHFEYEGEKYKQQLLIKIQKP